MSIERTFYCDGPDCDAHTRTVDPRPGMGFVIVDEDDSPTLHFCSWDCVLRHAAEIPPVEVVSAAGE